MMPDQKTPAQHTAYWEKAEPPVRPSREMLRIYQDYLKSTDLWQRGDWGLLGCTAEIRSLAAQHQRPLCCIDIDPHIYEATACLCSPKPNDTFLHNNWIHADCSSSFDLIIGDGSQSMLHPSEHNAFLANVHRMLRTKGHFFLRLQVHQPRHFHSTQEILDWYHEQPQQNSINQAIRSLLIIHWLDPATGTIDPKTFNENIDDLYQQKKLSDGEYQELCKKRMVFSLSYTTKEQFEQSIDSYFEVKDIQTPDDFYWAEHYPIYHLQKR